MTGPSVSVLLSTYNAGDLLDPLMASVCAQDAVSVRLVIRDDGSTDGTPKKLKELACQVGINVEYGTNIGPCGSYFRLLSTWAGSSEFVAFCDQDDVWLPRKLSAAICKLRSRGDSPALYSSRIIITDPWLNPIRCSPVPQRSVGFGNALVENVVMGPTVVLNAAGAKLLASKTPRFAVMHDAWAYLVLSAFGEIVYDPDPYILYRLHGHNAIGVRRRGATRFVRVAKHRAASYLDAQIRQAREFEILYGSQLAGEQRDLIGQLCQEQRRVWDRMNRAVRSSLYRQSKIDNMLLHMLLLKNIDPPVQHEL